MARTTVQQLADHGQSVWLDYISRSLIDTGALQQFIRKGVSGLTSNPSIFNKAVSAGNDYDGFIRELKAAGKKTFEIYDDLTVRDVQDAADIFLPVYNASKGVDGYVSLEIDPRLAHDTAPTIAEGRRLHKKVNRPNIMFKVPSTAAGFPAISALLAEGINVNVTLVFSLQQYMDTTDAYLRGLEMLDKNGGDLSTVRSVASVFVSRVDTMVDGLLDKRLQSGGMGENEKIAGSRGAAAVANAILIYDKYTRVFKDERFAELVRKGANVQRLLWGSTSTKNPAYSDIKYVTELIGKNTVNTIPQGTLQAFLEHGEVKGALPGDLDKAQQQLSVLKELGIDIDEVCSKLLDEGVRAFQESFSSLLRAIGEKAQKLGE